MQQLINEYIGGQAIAKKATYYRTARRIMEGYVYLKPWTMSQDLHV